MSKEFPKILNPDAIESILLVATEFQDPEKIAAWFNAPNPFLGATPIRLLMEGRSAKLKKWILNQLDENKPLREK